MVAFNFNAANYDPDLELTDVLESGTYSVQITKSEFKQTKSGTGYMLLFVYTVIDGDSAKKSITDRLNIKNQNPTAEELAHKALSAITRVCGLMGFADTQELHGRPFKIAVVKEPRNDKPGSFSNSIKAYMDMNGNPPTKDGPVGNAPSFAQQPVQQQPVQQQPQQQPVQQQNWQQQPQQQQQSAPAFPLNTNFQQQQQQPQDNAATPPWLLNR